MSRTSDTMPVAYGYDSVLTSRNLGRTGAKCREEAAVLRKKVDDTFKAAQGRDFTDEESKQVDQWVLEGTRLAREGKILDAWALDDSLNPDFGSPPARTTDSLRPDAGTRGARPSEWRDTEGRPVFMLAPTDRLQDLPRRKDVDPSASIGELIRCAITGNWRGASPTIRMVQSEGTDSAGGYLVPTELLNRVIDAARARSFVIRAGAKTVPMASDRMTLARVASDPTFEVKAENAAFAGSTITFDQLGFSAHLVGTLITCSRELAEDAPNFVEEVEGILSRAFAAALDNIAVNGISSSGLDGILDWATPTGIGETGSVGAIAWEDLQTAVVGIQTQNFEPTGYVVHPEIAGDLAALTSGDGANSAKMWLGPPSNVAPLSQFVSTHIANSAIIVGDWSQFVWAIRQGARIEVSREAGDAFAKHQVLIKLTWRGDTGAFRRNAFHRLVGITT